jgi:hypothetical protein
MEPEVSLPCSQRPITGPYPEPDSSTPHLLTLFPKIHSNITFPSTPRSFEWSLSFRFSDRNLLRSSHRYMRATWLAYPVFLDLITIIRFGKVYRLWSSSLCSLLRPPATCSILDPNIPLSTLFSKHFESIFNFHTYTKQQVSYSPVYILNWILGTNSPEKGMRATKLWMVVPLTEPSTTQVRVHCPYT